MKKNLFTINGEIISVSDTIHIDRKEKSSFDKIMLGVRTKDSQVLFVEVREIPAEPLIVGENASVEFYFAGSVKGDKSYNNIIAKSVTVNG